MSILKDSPFGPYTAYELQEWIKALQQELEKERAIRDLLERMNENSRKLIESDREMRFLDGKVRESLEKQIAALERAMQSPLSYLTSSLN